MPPGDDLGPVVERGSELRDEAALADPRLADDGDELHRGLALGAQERLEHQLSSCSRPTNGVWVAASG